MLHSTVHRSPASGRRLGVALAITAVIASCGGDDDVDDAPATTISGVESTIAESTDSSPSPAATTTLAADVTTTEAADVTTTEAPATTAATTSTTTAPPATDAPTTTVVPTTAAPTTTAASVLSFPESFLGTWRESQSGGVTPDQCREDGESVENFGRVMTIRPDGYGFFEEGGRLLEVHDRTESRFEATFDTTYADEATQDRLRFELADGALILSGGGGDVTSNPVRYAPCPREVASLTANGARELVVSLGDWEPDMSTYDPSAALSAVEAVPPGAASAAAPEQIFLFASGRYVETPTPEPRIASSFERVDDVTLRLTYGQYAPDDPFCCPSLDPWIVEVRWEGGVVVYDGDLPPQDQGLA